MKKSLLLGLFLMVAGMLNAQTKKSLTWDDVIKWNRITETSVSSDGNYVVTKYEPWQGDAVMQLFDKNGKEVVAITGANSHQFTTDGKYVLFTQYPLTADITALKEKKAKKEDYPKNKLGILSVTGNVVYIDSLQSYKLPADWSGYVAYQKVPAKSGEKSALVIRNLASQQETVIPAVTGFKFADEAEYLIYAVQGDNPGVYLYDLKKGAPVALYSGSQKVAQLAVNKNGTRAAFIVVNDGNDKTGSSNELYYWKGNGTASSVAAKGKAGIPENWIVNENQSLTFADNTNRLFFQTAPAYLEKDTTMLERPVVETWHWQDPKIYTQQVVDKEKDLKAGYLAVYLEDKGTVTQLANEDMPRVELIDKGDSDMALVQTSVPYEVEGMWESPARSDIYLMNITNAELETVLKGARARVSVSPAAKYLYWYQSADSSWYTYNIAEKQQVKLTDPVSLPTYNEINDVPNYANAYGCPGWTANDESIWLYDRFDIWQLDPMNKKAPVNLTVSGREKQLQYRIVKFDRDEKFIDPNKQLFLQVYNQTTKGSGYAVATLNKPVVPTMIMQGDYRLTAPVKAKNSDVIIYTKENFELFPDVLLSDLSLKNSVQLTNANPQQKEFNWGTAELVSWISADGIRLEGVLYKPENFDPNKKYPMICSFYEKNSDEFNSYRTPEVHRSTIDYHYYTSNGYLIFNPDIVYTDGYPGESCFNALMPGISVLIDRGFVDEKRIGAQGHSWGGYQVAYLAAHTRLFAAIESGAPVVNMISAYGGIRWATGINRAFQYERGQSRIGHSIWDTPLRYIENSPIFNMDKVTTPILIMANDHDGHVPWWQGIEYYVALRRLQKPAWLLNYNNEPHWPQVFANKLDFQKRMEQFFNHYLKDEPMPEWMEKGRPEVVKDVTLGY